MSPPFNPSSQRRLLILKDRFLSVVTRPCHCPDLGRFVWDCTDSGLWCHGLSRGPPSPPLLIGVDCDVGLVWLSRLMYVCLR